MLLVRVVWCLLLLDSSLARSRFTHVGRSRLTPVSSSFHLHDALGLASSGARTALKLLSPVSGRDSHCRRDSRLLLTGLLRRRRWAMHMLDAQPSLPDGLLAGRWAAFGSPEQCTGVNVELGGTGVTVQGQYCLAYVRWSALEETASRARSLRALPQLYGIASAGHLDSFQLGRCVPASCSAEDVEQGLRDALGAEEVHVDARNCHTSLAAAAEVRDVVVPTPAELQAGSRDWRRLPAPVLVCLCCLAVLLAVQAFATIVDTVVRTEGKAEGRAMEAVLDTLSWLRLVPALGGRASALPAADAVACLALNRLALELTLLSSLLTLPYTNVTQLHDTLSGPLRPLLAALSGYDALLTVGGLTAGYSLRRRLTGTGRSLRTLLLVLLGRYLRLLALLGAVLLLLLSVFVHVSDGPTWRQLAHDLVVGPCAGPERWWPVLTLLNNYYSPLENCMGHAWFLAAQAQLWAVSPPLVLLVVRLPRLGTALLVILTIGALAAPPAITVLSHLPAFFTTHDLEINQRLWGRVFTATHARAGPWMLGLLTGLLLHACRGRPTFLRGNIPVLASGWTLAVGLPVARALGVLPFSGPAAPPAPLWFTATFSSLAGPCTALSVCWIVAACQLGHGGLVARFLALSGFRWMRRVSAAGYLLLVPALLARWLAVQHAQPWSLALALSVWLLALLTVMPMAAVLTVAVAQPLTTVGRRLVPDEAEEDELPPPSRSSQTPDLRVWTPALQHKREMTQHRPASPSNIPCVQQSTASLRHVSTIQVNSEDTDDVNIQPPEQQFSLTANLVSSEVESQGSPTNLRRAMSTLPKRQVSPTLLRRHLTRYRSVRLDQAPSRKPRELSETRGNDYVDHARRSLDGAGMTATFAKDCARSLINPSADRTEDCEEGEEDWRSSTSTRFPLHPRRYLPELRDAVANRAGRGSSDEAAQRHDCRRDVRTRHD